MNTMGCSNLCTLEALNAWSNRVLLISSEIQLSLNRYSSASGWNWSEIESRAEIVMLERRRHAVDLSCRETSASGLLAPAAYSLSNPLAISRALMRLVIDHESVADLA